MASKAFETETIGAKIGNGIRSRRGRRGEGGREVGHRERRKL